MVQELLQNIQVKRIILEINPLKRNATMPVCMYLIVFEDYGEATSEIRITSEEILQKTSYTQENKPEKKLRFFKLTFWREFVLTDLQGTERPAFFILK